MTDRAMVVVLEAQGNLDVQTLEAGDTFASETTNGARTMYLVEQVEMVAFASSGDQIYGTLWYESPPQAFFGFDVTAGPNGIVNATWRGALTLASGESIGWLLQASAAAQWSVMIQGRWLSYHVDLTP